jgi:probable phosphoglycerate mutase
MVPRHSTGTSDHPKDTTRLRRARDRLNGQNGTVLAVTHGLMSRIIRGAYLGLPPKEALELPVTQGVVWRLAEGSETTL